MNTEIRTGAVDLVSGSTTETFNPMTGALSTADIVDVRFGAWLSGLGSNIKVRPGLQFSVDGVNWSDSPVGVYFTGTSYTTAVGWTFDDGSWKTIASLATQRLFVRFGLMAANVSGTTTEGVQARLIVQIKPQVATTITAGPVRAWCYNTANGSKVFIPMTGWVPAEQCATVRGTIEMAATSGNVGAYCCWQQANEPSVPSDWSGGTYTEQFGTEQTSNGISFGTTFAAPPGTSVTKKYLRFGVIVRNTSANAIEACQATIRVDLRG